MPRTTDRVALDDPVGEQCAIVRACGADREEHLAATNDQNRFSVRLSGNYARSSPGYGAVAHSTTSNVADGGLCLRQSVFFDSHPAGVETAEEDAS